MGCDIHLHAEIKVLGSWHHYSHPRIARWYGLFAKMANVRNYPEWNIEPIAQPRGLPADISFTTRLDVDHWGVDGHSHSWLSSDEIGQLVEWVDGQKRGEGYFSFEHHQVGYCFENGWDIKKYPRADGKGYDGQPEWLEDVRWVFWFDN